jgi:hypothetical protein
MRSLVAMPRYAALVIGLGLILVPATAQAADKSPVPSPSPSATAAADDRSRDGGVITGTVTNVDYNAGIISVDSTTQGKVDVQTMPSTSVTADEPGYHSLTDVSKGSKVQIFISKTAGKLVAQIIHLIKH